MITAKNDRQQQPAIPWFGARRIAQSLSAELRAAKQSLTEAEQRAESLLVEVGGCRSRCIDLEQELANPALKGAIELVAKGAVLEEAFTGRRAEIQAELDRMATTRDKFYSDFSRQIDEAAKRFSDASTGYQDKIAAAQNRLFEISAALAETEDAALLQEIGIYSYRHPLSDAVAYQARLAELDSQIRQMARKDGGAVFSATNWTVNGSATEGRAMIRECSKLMLRAFNAEADSLVRWLRPHKLGAALDRLQKTAGIIERLGRTMKIAIAPDYLRLRSTELELVSDFLQKQAGEKEIERVERERLREERRVQRELEVERGRLAKERQHYHNALQALQAKNDAEGSERLKERLSEIDLAIENVDYRSVNIRAGYVYVISNLGSFGDSVVKIGLTRRLDPHERIKELSDASVPFNFDVHALFFSKDAVGIEAEMHRRLEGCRVNGVNRRREFFRITPAEVKVHLGQLAGELLEFEEAPEALEFRQSLSLA